MKFYISDKHSLAVNTHLFYFVHDYSICSDLDNIHAKIVQDKFLQIISNSIYWSEDGYIQLPMCENWSIISKHTSAYTNMYVFSIKLNEESFGKLNRDNKIRAKNKIRERMGKKIEETEIIESEYIVNNSYATVIKPNIVSESFFSFYILHKDIELIDRISDFFISKGLCREDSLQQNYNLFFNIDFNSQLGYVPSP